MQNKFTTLVQVTDIPIDATNNLVHSLNKAEREVEKSLGGIEDEPGGRDVVNEFERYSLKTNEIAFLLQIHTEAMKNLAGDVDEILHVLGLLVDRLPFCCAFGALSPTGQNAERWCDDNCSAGYEFFSIKNACMVVFDTKADWMLFRINFGLT